MPQPPRHGGRLFLLAALGYVGAAWWLEQPAFYGLAVAFLVLGLRQLRADRRSL